MTEKERLLASVLALTVVFVILFSGFFVIAEANHDCIEEDCPICCQISVCENTLRSAGTVRTTAVFAAF